METLANSANRGSVSTGYDVSNSLKFEDGTNERLRRDNPNSGQRRTYTVAMWLKRTELGYNRIWGVGISGNDIQAPYFKDTDELIWYDYGAGGYRFNYHTNRKFRDTASWYHLVFAVDTEQSTQADRVKLYVNGVEETSFSTQTEPSQNADTNWNYQGTWDVGTAIGEDPHFSGYMSEVYFIDDQQLDCTNFGEFDDDTGIWKPKEFSGTFGSNDVYANFDDASSLGADSSGNSNDWTTVNITSADQAQDSPTNNFATFNALQPLAASTNIAQGATQFYISSNWQTAVASIAVSKGKWYAEFSPDSSTTIVGFVDVEDAYIPQNHTGYYLGYAGGNQNRSVGMQGSNGVIMNDNNSATGATFGASDIISLALDMDNRKAYWAVNGTWVNSGNPSNGTNGVTWATSSTLGDAWTDVITMGVTGYSNIHWKCNFGGFTLLSTNGKSDSNGYGVFYYDVPTGFYSLCSKNLAEEG